MWNTNNDDENPPTFDTGTMIVLGSITIVTIICATVMIVFLDGDAESKIAMITAFLGMISAATGMIWNNERIKKSQKRISHVEKKQEHLEKKMDSSADLNNNSPPLP